jgi:hypothetical protein
MNITFVGSEKSGKSGPIDGTENITQMIKNTGVRTRKTCGYL